MDPISIFIIALALKYAGTDVLYALRGLANPNHETKAKALSTRAQVRAQNAQLRNEKTKARLAKVKARGNKSISPARRYAQVLKDDAFEDALERHTRKREARKAKVGADNQDPGNTSGARGPARVFISNKAADARRDIRKWWNDRWEEAERNRQGQNLKARPNDDVIPGAVVPDAQDTTKPQPEKAQAMVKDCRNCDGWPNITIGSLRHTHDEYCQAPDILYPDDAPDTEPTNRYGLTVPKDAAGYTCPNCGKPLAVAQESMHLDEGNGSAMVDLRCNCGGSTTYYWTPTDEEFKDFFGHDVGEDGDDPDDFHVTVLNEDDPSGSPSYDGPVGGANEHLEIGIYDTADGGSLVVDAHGSNYWPYDPELAATPIPNLTPEGTTPMSNTSIEAIDLPTTISNCGSTAENLQGAANGIELTVAGLETSGTSGPAISHLVAAQEKINGAAADLRAAAAELGTHTGVTDAYAATGGHAGSKEFVTGG